MCKKGARITLIFGKNGSGKSELVRELMKKKGSYLFQFNDHFSENFVDKEKAQHMFHMLTGKAIADIVSPSFSEETIMLFCYELEAILEMQRPYCRLFIDGFPFEMDTKTLYNFIELFEYLASLDIKVTITTCKENVRDHFVSYFGDIQDFKLIEL